jgi:hypothetical protein
MKDQANIPLHKAQYQRFFAIKAKAAHDAGRPLSWAEFLERVFETYQASQGQVVEMRQEIGEHGATNEEAVFDEAMTMKMGAALGRPILLSDDTCDRIAGQLARKLRRVVGREATRTTSRRGRS